VLGIFLLIFRLLFAEKSMGGWDRGQLSLPLSPLLVCSLFLRVAVAKRKEQNASLCVASFARA
jgi:hypothetical protein